MDCANLLESESYDPNNLLDRLVEEMGLKNDAALARVLEVKPPVLSKIRHRGQGRHVNIVVGRATFIAGAPRVYAYVHKEVTSAAAESSQNRRQLFYKI